MNVNHNEEEEDASYRGDVNLGDNVMSAQPPARCFSRSPDLPFDDAMRALLSVTEVPPDRPDLDSFIPDGDDADMVIAFVRQEVRNVKQRAIVADLQVSCCLTDDDLCALVSMEIEHPYPVYRWMNGWLQSTRRDDTSKTRVGPLFKLIYRAMEKLPKVRTRATRAVRVNGIPTLQNTYMNYSRTLITEMELSFWGFASFSSNDDVMSNPAFVGNVVDPAIVYMCGWLEGVDMEPFLPRGAISECEVVPMCPAVFTVQVATKIGSKVCVSLAHHTERHRLVAYVAPGVTPLYTVATKMIPPTRSQLEILSDDSTPKQQQHQLQQQHVDSVHELEKELMTVQSQLQRLNKEKLKFIPLFVEEEDDIISDKKTSVFTQISSTVQSGQNGDDNHHHKAFDDVAMAWNYFCMMNVAESTKKGRSDLLPVTQLRMFLEAPAGSGKTTIIKWIGREPEKLRNRHNAPFKCAVVVGLARLEEHFLSLGRTAGLSSAINVALLVFSMPGMMDYASEMWFGEQSADECAAALTNPLAMDSVLYILDGFDELPRATSPLMRTLIIALQAESMEVLPCMHHVIVTSRPERMQWLGNTELFTKNRFLTLSLDPWSASACKEYARRFFSSSFAGGVDAPPLDCAPSLLCDDCRPITVHMMCVALLAQHQQQHHRSDAKGGGGGGGSSYYEQSNELISSPAALVVERVIDATLQRHCALRRAECTAISIEQQNGDGELSNRNRREIERLSKRQKQRLAEIAFAAVTTEKDCIRRTLITLTDADRAVGCVKVNDQSVDGLNLERCGLLEAVVCRTTRKYKFLHKTVSDFLAAWYIVEHIENPSEAVKGTSLMSRLELTESFEVLFFIEDLLQHHHNRRDVLSRRIGEVVNVVVQMFAALCRKVDKEEEGEQRHKAAGTIEKEREEHHTEVETKDISQQQQQQQGHPVLNTNSAEPSIRRRYVDEHWVRAVMMFLIRVLGGGWSRGTCRNECTGISSACRVLRSINDKTALRILVEFLTTSPQAEAWTKDLEPDLLADVFDELATETESAYVISAWSETAAYWIATIPRPAHQVTSISWLLAAAANGVSHTTDDIFRRHSAEVSALAWHALHRIRCSSSSTEGGRGGSSMPGALASLCCGWALSEVDASRRSLQPMTDKLRDVPIMILFPELLRQYAEWERLRFAADPKQWRSRMESTFVPVLAGYIAQDRDDFAVGTVLSLMVAPAFSIGSPKLKLPLLRRSPQGFNGSGSWFHSFEFDAGQPQLAVPLSAVANAISVPSSVFRPTRMLHTLFGTPSLGAVQSVACSPNSRRIATAYSGGMAVNIWDAIKGTCVNTLVGHSAAVTSVAYSPSGCLIITGSNDKTVKVWSESDGKCVLTLEGHSQPVSSAVSSPDGNCIASCSLDGMIMVWDVLNGGRRVQTLLSEHPCELLYSVAYSPDGRHIVVGCSDRTIKIWDVQNGGKCVTTLSAGHRSAGNACCAVYSPDGRHIVTATRRDNSVKIYDATGNGNGCVRTLSGHTNEVQCVALSVDGRHIVSGSLDKTAKIWDAQSGSCLHTFIHKSEVLSFYYFYARDKGGTYFGNSFDPKGSGNQDKTHVLLLATQNLRGTSPLFANK